MSTPTTTSKPTPKAAKKSKIITLRLTPEHLSRWPSDTAPKPSVPDPSPSIQVSDAGEKASELNGTPMPPNPYVITDPDRMHLPPDRRDPLLYDKLGRRRRGGAGVAGRKRAPPSIDPNGPIRERGRPGPKRKPRLPDGTIDRSVENAAKPNGVHPTPAHRLGPKANTGNINANLRALDRTGKPCRKWERKPLVIKSFTGMMWGMPSWKAPNKDQGFAGDVKSDSTGSSELKPGESSAVASERSNSGGDGNGDATMMNGIESSPAPPVPA